MLCFYSPLSRHPNLAHPSRAVPQPEVLPEEGPLLQLILSLAIDEPQIGSLPGQRYVEAGVNLSEPRPALAIQSSTQNM